MNQKFHVGHQSYGGANRLKTHYLYCTALWDLLSRGIKMAQAHKKLRQAMAGSFVVCSNKRGDVVELSYWKERM